jgi:hypothetical protein
MLYTNAGTINDVIEPDRGASSELCSAEPQKTVMEQTRRLCVDAIHYAWLDMI